MEARQEIEAVYAVPTQREGVTEAENEIIEQALRILVRLSMAERGLI